ncbi:hypothetical protein BDA99DRAFT_535087 [Phascolomyces articulosus]|uniref:Uncharacterized protein n=1 Tax=Phascolomyces articulosus TaxID=60185 RepID=A0AAD5KFF5_9FUNG|nr:hypothetical protein BDA99DRAFT_535087 [Phascolomyces articulosus]
MEQESPSFSLGGGIYQAINRCFQHNTMEEIVSALNEEKGAPQWAKETYNCFANVANIFKNFIATIQCWIMFASKEFLEGTSAALVTKTAPNWNPSTLEQVNVNEVKRNFFDGPIDNPLKTLYDGGNHTESLHTESILPKCSDIVSVAKKKSHEETIKYFLDKYSGKSGVKAKVINVLNN